MIRIHGLVVHTRLQALTQLRSRQSLAYGLGVPLLFLLGFGALYRAGEPPLLAQMGQLTVITLLGGACFGLPTLLVSEREAGVWRRHRLAAVSLGWMLAPVLLIRSILILAGLILQAVLAHAIWGTPWPADGVALVGALALGLAAFLSLGLVVAGVSDSVPAVQGLGQLLFLPMIILGGVGVPLPALPEWAQRFSAFTPGRYAVELIQAAWLGRPPAGGAETATVALLCMTFAAALAGVLWFRWDPLAKPSLSRRLTCLVALVPWVIAGISAAHRETWRPSVFPSEYSLLTDEQIRAIPFADLPGDEEFVTPMGPADLTARPLLRDVLTLLATWPRGNTGDTERDVRALVSVAALADAAQDVTERDYARAVYEHLRARYPRHELRAVLAWLALRPEAGEVLTSAPELGIRRRAAEALVRERVALYARKYLGRLEGAIKEPPPRRP